MKKELKAPIKVDDAEVEASMFDAMLTSMAGGNPSDAILRQEARAQDSAREADVLPIKGLHEIRDQLLKAGGEILEPADKLLTYVRLPPGWQKVSLGGYGYWTNVVDDRGRVRASYFYKGAFYDRDAFLRASPRFKVQVERDYDAHTWQMVVTDGGSDRIVFSTEKEPFDPEARGVETYNQREAREQEWQALGAQWLVDQGYPDWKDHNAYWD